MLRLEIICGTYFLCGIMDCMVGSLRGLGYSVIPMFVSLTAPADSVRCGIYRVCGIPFPGRALSVLSGVLGHHGHCHMITFRKIRRKIPRQDAVPLA